MRIVCPSCDTAYDAPDSVVASGKLMRCARCRTAWNPGKPIEAESPPDAPLPMLNTRQYMPDTQPSLDAAPEPVFAPAPEPRAAQAITPPLAECEPVILAPFPDPLPAPEPPRKAVIAAWAGSVLVLVAAVWLAIAFRQPIMRGWPASARAYAALGYK